MLLFDKTYFTAFVGLLVTEILIALFAHDQIIRPYIGDLLVVILLYAFIKSFLNVPVTPTVIFVLLFSYLIETLQYFNMVQHLGLGKSIIANIILGN